MEAPIRQDYSSNNAYNRAMKEYRQFNRRTKIELTWTPNQMVERIMELESQQQDQVDATKDMLTEIISWEKDLSEYESLESILRKKYTISKRKDNKWKN